ncbi:hypothetical protein Q2T83_12090 [Fervidibacter sacchari]|uniref:Uncharacterized protein n=1 Tax=Candidatus Fervidibacter sacchari TaxID=1448929 RepID=A0ABT2EN13_9BACT|nr:hypothetical protein [Candidatus Fervidibacter sacchari]MCS3919337.1 hypothetical protein [Candidatus Fervidibacter sacchari]WKU15075.1 hypothetical protein Q2T83_12090 [Candidatus Fervidibacter sacchari]
MTVEEILREIEKQLGELDERAKEAVKLALKLVQGETEKATEPVWQGENPPFEQMASLDIEERSRIMNKLEERNREWLLRKCEELGAMWLLVVDGQVYAHGKNLADNPPTEEEILELANQTGKLPLFFIHPSLLWVEETAWHPTIYAGDFYPAVRCRFHGNGSFGDTIADFDTGSASTFVSYEEMSAQGIVQLLPSDVIRQLSHLGQVFRFFVRTLHLGLIADDGSERIARLRVLCILNWQQSPFVAVNPNRVALIGRDICLRLQPKITLDFANRQTLLSF